MTHGTGMFVSLSRDQRRRLAELARERRVTTSSLVREAVSWWIAAGAPVPDHDDEVAPDREHDEVLEGDAEIAERHRELDDQLTERLSDERA